MGIFLWIVYGAIIGWLASIITGNNSRMGCIGNIIAGLVGSLVGGWIASMLGFGDYATWSWQGMLISIGGAALVLFVFNLLFHRRG